MTSPFARFVGVGTFCALLNLAIQYSGTGLIGLHYAVSVSVSFVIVNYIGFRLNKAFTFGDRDPRIVRQATRYYGVMVLSLAANLALMAILVDGLGLHYLVAALLVTAFFVCLNFLAHRTITFGTTRG